MQKRTANCIRNRSGLVRCIEEGILKGYEVHSTEQFQSQKKVPSHPIISSTVHSEFDSKPMRFHQTAQPHKVALTSLSTLQDDTISAPSQPLEPQTRKHDLRGISWLGTRRLNALGPLDSNARVVDRCDGDWIPNEWVSKDTTGIVPEHDISTRVSSKEEKKKKKKEKKTYHKILPSTV
jgi:hypothetical protein